MLYNNECNIYSTQIISIIITFIVIFTIPCYSLYKRLKAALHYSVGKVCEDIQNEQQDNSIMKDVIAAINELVMHQCETIATDLESFAK